MAERLEASFLSFDESELFYQLWRPPIEGESRGYVIITHGLGEHSECYHELALELAQDQWTVLAWDLRGHGRSEGKRGYVRNFRDMVEDLKYFLQHFMQSYNHPNNVFLLGHSLGGLVLLSYVLNEPTEGIKACIFSSPALGISMPIPAIKEKGASFLAEWAPKLTLHNGIKYEDLHRNSDRLKRYYNDPLRHDKISPRLFLGMQEAMTEAMARAEDVHIPCLFQLAGDDRLVDTPTSESIYKALASKDKKLYVYPESLHEIYNDVDREHPINDLKSFLQAHREAAKS